MSLRVRTRPRGSGRRKLPSLLARRGEAPLCTGPQRNPDVSDRDRPESPAAQELHPKPCPALPPRGTPSGERGAWVSQVRSGVRGEGRGLNIFPPPRRRLLFGLSPPPPAHCRPPSWGASFPGFVPLAPWARVRWGGRACRTSDPLTPLRSLQNSFASAATPLTKIFIGLWLAGPCETCCAARRVTGAHGTKTPHTGKP